MTKTNIVLIILALVATIIAYQTLVVIPRERMEYQMQKDEEERNAELARRSYREASYDVCIMKATEAYSASWDADCKLLNKGDNCALPIYRAEKFTEHLEQEKDRCVSMWK